MPPAPKFMVDWQPEGRGVSSTRAAVTMRRLAKVEAHGLNGRQHRVAMTSPSDHERLKASSLRVQATCRAICDALEAEGLTFKRLGPTGFAYEAEGKIVVWIDPKLEWLRIKVGLRPSPPVPQELVHWGRQPAWIVVRPEHTNIGVAYLAAFARTHSASMR
jgi:hypothetical protein